MNQQGSFAARLGLCLALLALPGLSPCHAFSVTFDQVDWSAEGGGYTAQNSEWGQANIHFSAGDAALFAPLDGGFVGFVNIVTRLPASAAADNWAVQNLPVYFNSAAELDGRLPESVWFDLGIARGTEDVRRLDYSASLTSFVLPTQPVGPMFRFDAVGDRSVLLGGVSDPDAYASASASTGQAAPPAARNFEGLKAGEKVGTVGSILVDEKKIAFVQEDLNGCAPASKARSLKYLAERGSITLADSAGTIYGDLKTDMKTEVGAGKKGTTINPSDDFKKGADAYAQRKKIDVKTKRLRDVEEVKKLMKAGADVELAVFWGKRKVIDPTTGKEVEESLGGHAAFVSQIIDIIDKDGKAVGYTVRIIDDDQTNNGDTANQTHTLKFDQNGQLIWTNDLVFGSSARMLYFYVEQVPEPASLALFLLSLALLADRRWRTTGRPLVRRRAD